MSPTPQPVDSLAPNSAETDVCIIVEGCYPFVPGGVSAWIDWLMRSQPETRFSLVSLWPRPMGMKSRYMAPANLMRFEQLFIQEFGAPPRRAGAVLKSAPDLAQALTKLMTQGGRDALSVSMHELDAIARTTSIEQLFNSPSAWDVVQDMYRREMPNASFIDYFWAWRALLSGLLAVLRYPLPRARVYHTISTGYAGLLAARAAIETGRPAILTEHGIYTNERRIELLMADWVADTIDKGHALDDPRFDLRDMWVRAFEAYARTCYESATSVVTLYRDNQGPQRVLGAVDGQLSVIANGIDVKRFAHLGVAGGEQRPTIALIGRVVPIKDVKTFIEAVKLLAPRVANLRALVVGPTEEDPAYYAECARIVVQEKLETVVEFTGPVNILDYLEQIHVMALTSLSESQPLVVLEAGAAGIPFIATDVGSCREIIEGPPDESPHLGAGGIVTHLAAADEIADAAARLLTDHDLRWRMGEALRARVAAYYTSERAADAYQHLYARLVSDEGGTRLTGAA